MLDNNFKASAQIDRWMVEFSSTLKSIICPKGITMAYVIMVADAPKLSGHTKWENKAIARALLSRVN